MGHAGLRVELATCHRDSVQDERYAVFGAEMASLRRGDRMAMRFDLQRRAPGERRFESLDVPGLGVWHRARRGRSPYSFDQRVERLAAPASYRARVTFRWTGPGNAEKVVVRRVTEACKQPGDASDLGVRAAGAGGPEASSAPARRR